MSEEWVDVVHKKIAADTYEVSRSGVIRRKAYEVKNTRGLLRKYEAKPVAITPVGYVNIIRGNNRRTYVSAAKMIYEAFNGPLPSTHHVQPKDENPNNFAIDNLILVKRGSKGGKRHKPVTKKPGLKSRLAAIMVERERESVNDILAVIEKDAEAAARSGRRTVTVKVDLQRLSKDSLASLVANIDVSVKVYRSENTITLCW